MKKVLLILIFVLALSACAGPADTEQTMKNNLNDKQNNPVNTNIKDVKKSATNSPGAPELTDLRAEYDQAIIDTNFGEIKVAFYADESPYTVNNFMNLAQKGFYDNTLFHRIIKDFMVQGGDPNSKDGDWSNDGMGGPGYKFNDEFNSHKLVLGSLAMANSGPNTNGSQFFIVTATSTPWLDGKHTNFGYVVSGLETLRKMEKVNVDSRNHPLEDVIIKKISLIKSSDSDENGTSDIEGGEKKVDTKLNIEDDETKETEKKNSEDTSKKNSEDTSKKDSGVKTKLQIEQ